MTAADGTTTTTTEVTVIKDGRRTTTVTTQVSKRGSPTTTEKKKTEAVTDRGEDSDPPDSPSPDQPRVAGARPAAFVGDALVSEALEQHNRVRRKVGVPPLAWDEGLARFAAEWASHLCRDGKGPATLTHRPRGLGVPGENLWVSMSSEPQLAPVAEAVKSWAAESRFYDARSGRCHGGVCGHYTQLAWRGTSHVGCAAATCPTSGMQATLWVCNYKPAGNVTGEKAY